LIQSRTRKRAGSYACASHHYRDLTIAALSARLQTRTRKRAGSSACQSVPIRDLTIAALYAVKILYLAHRIPYPPNKGDKIRSFHEIKHFSRNHQLHLLAFDDNPGDARHADALLRLCSTVEIVPLDSRRQSTRALLSMLSGNPWTLGYFRSPEMQRKVAAKLKDANLAFVYSSSMAPYVANAPVPKVLDFVDSDAAKWQQYSERKSPSFLYSYEAHRLAQFEQQMTARFDFSVFVSPREAEHLPKSDRIRFITNGIDLDFYQPINTNTKSHDIIFTGLMDYFPNIDAAVFFARDVFPLIRSRVPDARFVIAGARPSASVKRLIRIPGVTITGTVPDIRSPVSRWCLFGSPRASRTRFSRPWPWAFPSSPLRRWHQACRSYRFLSPRTYPPSRQQLLNAS